MRSKQRTITQEELEAVQYMRLQQRQLSQSVNDIKDRIARNARIERGPLIPDIRTSYCIDTSTKALQDILGEEAAELLDRLPQKERKALWIVRNEGVKRSTNFCYDRE